MPLKKGHSREVVSSNIKEMIAAGHDPKQAVAASLANARKYKKMADGGMVDFDNDDNERTNNAENAQRSLSEIQAQGRSLPQDVENPEMEAHDDKLAKALYDKAEEEEMSAFSAGGLVEEHDTNVGNKPDMEIASVMAEPLSDEPEKPAEMEHEMPGGLSEAAKQALMAKKRKRMFS